MYVLSAEYASKAETVIDFGFCEGSFNGLPIIYRNVDIVFYPFTFRSRKAPPFVSQFVFSV